MQTDVHRVRSTADVPCVDQAHGAVYDDQTMWLTNLGGLLDMHPLAVVLEQEFVAAGGILEGDAVHRPGAKDSHSRCSLRLSQC